MNAVWIELVKAAVEGVAAGAQVFADRSKDVKERLEGDLKQALSDEDRKRLKDLADG